MKKIVKIISIFAIIAISCSLLTIFVAAEEVTSTACCKDCPTWCPICNFLCKNSVCYCWMSISAVLGGVVILLLLVLLAMKAKIRKMKKLYNEMSNLRVRFNMRVKTPGKMRVCLKNANQEKTPIRATLTQGEVLHVYSQASENK